MLQCSMRVICMLVGEVKTAVGEENERAFSLITLNKLLIKLLDAKKITLDKLQDARKR